jgi:hypothetical protein
VRGCPGHRETFSQVRIDAGTAGTAGTVSERVMDKGYRAAAPRHPHSVRSQPSWSTVHGDPKRKLRCKHDNSAQCRRRNPPHGVARGYCDTPAAVDASDSDSRFYHSSKRSPYWIRLFTETKRHSLAGKHFPVIFLAIGIQVVKAAIPIIYTAIDLEQELGLSKAPLMTLLSARIFLGIAPNAVNPAQVNLLESVLSTQPTAFLRLRVAYVIYAIIALQVILFLLVTFAGNYRFI